MKDDSSGGAKDDSGGEWLSIRQAAQRLGISRASVYGRIERGTLRTRAAGNRGHHVWVPHDMYGSMQGDSAPPELTAERLTQLEAEVEHWRSEAERRGAAEATLQGRLDELRAQLEAEATRLRDERDQTGELRERLARLEGEAAGAQAAAEAEVAAAKRIVTVLEEQLREARRPWWQRLLG